MKHYTAHGQVINKVVEETKHFAWIPTRMTSGSWVILQPYYIVVTYIAIPHTAFRRLEDEKFSEDEYIYWKLTNNE